MATRRLTPSELIKHSDNLADKVTKYMLQSPRNSERAFQALEDALFAYHRARWEEAQFDE
jgi:hypothetical protein